MQSLCSSGCCLFLCTPPNLFSGLGPGCQYPGFCTSCGFTAMASLGMG
jgi:hypothetical protein